MATRYLEVTGMVTPDVLQDDTEYGEVGFCAHLLFWCRVFYSVKDGAGFAYVSQERTRFRHSKNRCCWMVLLFLVHLSRLPVR